MTNENPDTLIAEARNIGGLCDGQGQTDDEDLIRRLADALTDLRTERDAALAVIDIIDKAANNNRDTHTEQLMIVRAFIATAPTTALADRDARILEEAAVITWHHIIELADTFFGDSSRLAIDAQATKAREAIRAVSRRREGGAE